MTREQEEHLEQAIEKAVEQTQEHATVKPFPPRPAAPPSLAAQWEIIAKHERDLRARVRRERLDIVAQYERLVTETHADFARREEFMLSELHGKRDAALRLLRDDAEVKMREHDLLSQRMGE